MNQQSRAAHGVAREYCQRPSQSLSYPIFPMAAEIKCGNHMQAPEVHVFRVSVTRTATDAARAEATSETEQSSKQVYIHDSV
ncbi:hypothetical protein EVAR_33504_1 [Eumeta japonica]|uniref:Uncharacterized protein n=1 Tax=Eumeta variegata TaxID=151549 RepID=A0A4C1WEH0_EUMVA|nr:hypothetical protein EVAR_33504_1 [Eumeta japonica]